MGELKDCLPERAIKDECQYGAEGYIVPVEDFSRVARHVRAIDGRLVAEWATDDRVFEKGFSIYSAYNLISKGIKQGKGSEYIIVKAELQKENTSFPTLTKYFPSAYRFERQIRSLFGILPEGNPDEREWILFEDWQEGVYPLRKDFDIGTVIPRREGVYKWIRAEGEGVYEIPVGPVHAGIIEPGHFRFQAAGEEILNMEERLGYCHKGIEKRFEGLSLKEGVKLAGRVSGDSTVAHSIAYSMAVEGMLELCPPERSLYLRAIMLERERIANHLLDIGAVCNDVAFAFLYYQFGNLRERMLRNNKKLFSHRLMMDAVIPGGVMMDIDSEGIDLILSEGEGLLREFERLIRIYEDNPSIEDRVYGTGVLQPSTAKELGVVGFVARASGQEMDARVQMPFLPYDRLTPKVPVLSSGDCHARVWVRVEEVRESLRLIGRMLDTIPDGKISTVLPSSLPQRQGFSVVEGWRGEIVYWIQTGADGVINRCMVRDPSFVNWLGLEYAVKGNMVPDFPLCNKSFNQSYSGNDL